MSTTRVKQLITFNGYLQVFYENCRITKTCFEAWEKTEQEYAQIFGQNRYSCYESFRVVRERKLKKYKKGNIV